MKGEMRRLAIIRWAALWVSIAVLAVWSYQENRTLREMLARERETVRELKEEVRRLRRGLNMISWRHDEDQEKHR